MPVGAVREGPAAPGEQFRMELREDINALRSQLAYDSKAMLGIPVPGELFQGLRGLDEARIEQFMRFSNCEVGTITGSGMGRRNLELLQRRAEEMLLSGIQITIEIGEGEDTGRFTIVNTNYIPLSAMDSGQKDMLVTAITNAQAYLETAETLFSQGDEAGAREHLGMAASIHLVYANYINSLNNAISFERALDGIASSQVAGHSENARDMVIVAEGRYARALELVASAMERLGICLGHIYGGDIAAFGEAYSGAMQDYSDSADYADNAAHMAGNLYRIAAASEGARAVGAIDFSEAFMVPRELYQPEAPMEEVGHMMRLPGADRYIRRLEGKRDEIRSLYLEVRRNSQIALAILGSEGQTAEDMETVARAESRAADAILRINEAKREMEGMASSLSIYASTLEHLRSAKYSSQLRNAGPGGALLAERDRLAAELDSAIRNGGTVANLLEKIRGLEYGRIASSLENFEFESVSGRSALSFLRGKRDALARDIRTAARNGSELENLAGRQEELASLYAEAAEFEAAVRGYSANIIARADNVQVAAEDCAARFREFLSGIPERVEYTGGGRGDMAARPVTVHLEGDKGFVERNLDRALASAGEAAEVRRGVERWRDSLLGSYVPGELVSDRRAEGLLSRYGAGSSAAFGGARSAERELIGIVARVESFFGNANRNASILVENYNSAVLEAGREESIRSGFDLFDPLMVPFLALGGVRAVDATVRLGQMAWRGITLRAATSPTYAFIENSIRGIPTLATIAQTSYGAYRIVTAGSMHDVVEGSLWLGSAGLWNLPGMLGRVERSVAVVGDALGFVGSAAAIGLSLGRAAELGTAEGWWDFTKIAAFASFQGAFSAIGVNRLLMVPGGFRRVLAGGQLDGMLLTLDDLERAGIRVSEGSVALDGRRVGGRVRAEDVDMSTLVPVVRGDANPVTARDLMAAESMAGADVGIETANNVRRRLADFGLNQDEAGQLMSEFSINELANKLDYAQLYSQEVIAAFKVMSQERRLGFLRGTIENLMGELERIQDTIAEIKKILIQFPIRREYSRYAPEIYARLDYVAHPEILLMGRDRLSMAFRAAITEPEVMAGARRMVREHIERYATLPPGIQADVQLSEREVISTLESMGFRFDRMTNGHKRYVRYLEDGTMQRVNLDGGMYPSGRLKRYLRQDVRYGVDGRTPVSLEAGDALFNELVCAFKRNVTGYTMPDIVIFR